MSTRKPEDFPNYTKVRYAQRASYERQEGYDILDKGLIAHVGFVADGRPMVIPMAFARIDDTIYIHGASKTRIIKSHDDKAPVTLTVTHLDGLVIARSAMHHSVNYRSAIVHGTARAVTDADEFDRALAATTDHLMPGRWDECRPMNAIERKATGVLAIDVEHVTAKVRNGLPGDDEKDLELNMWSGVIPVTTSLGHPLPDHNTNAQTPLPPVPQSLARAKEKFG